MSIRDFFTLPALLMFVLGVLSSMYVKSLVGRVTGKVAG